MGVFGTVQKCEPLQAQVTDNLGLPKSMIVTYAMYDAHRDPPAAFRNDAVYTVELFDLKRGPQAKRANPDEAFLQQYDTDRRSVYIGGLPCGVTEEQIRSLFKDSGEVGKINLVKKDSSGSRMTCFGFVEFGSPDEPDRAVELHNGTTFNGYTIRVERKMGKARSPKKVTSPQFPKAQTQTQTQTQAQAQTQAQSPDTGKFKTPATPTTRNRFRENIMPQQQPHAPTELPPMQMPQYGWPYQGTQMSPYGGQAGGHPDDAAGHAGHDALRLLPILWHSEPRYVLFAVLGVAAHVPAPAGCQHDSNTDEATLSECSVRPWSAFSQ